METNKAGIAARLVTTEELRANGWSKGMVQRFLGGHSRAYPLDRVEAIEAGPKFLAAYRQALLAR